MGIQEAELAADAAALEKLGLWTLRLYSPLVAIDAPDGLVIDATGAAHLHGGENAMLGDMVTRIPAAGIRARAAMADTWGSAHAFARASSKPVICTNMTIERQYVDSHGQSEVAFAFCHLLGFELAPKLKAIARQKPYIADASLRSELGNLLPILTRIIDWDLIERQYNEMIKYTAALRYRTADPEAILGRFAGSAVQHPTYSALAELGKVIKAMFLCQYIGREELRREINAGLNVVENWNGAHSFIFYGKGGELASNRLEYQEISVLCLHLLQNCLVYVNTLMLQQVPAEPAWLSRMTAADHRGLSPVVHSHINPYGRLTADLNRRIDFEQRRAA